MKKEMKGKSFEDSTSREFTVLNDTFNSLDRIINDKDEILKLGILDSEEVDALGRIKEKTGFVLYRKFFKLI